ncbi:MAG: SDR family oxidoreductase [Candidatus Kariarchaeaceae archaeon]|jgi:uncharacterized protein YbjT (DUF2867 family)
MTQKILVLGGTGYVGNRLITVLLQEGYKVRVTYRNKEKIKNRVWTNQPNIETAYADVYDQESMIRAFHGCTNVYYLVHSMYPGQTDFMKMDRIAARNTVYAAGKAGIDNIIYLGGLGSGGTNISKHLKSRAQVGKLLQAGSIPTTVLQAAMIIGSGSTSFEMLRYLVDRLPFMITPKWVYTNNQPIGIRNVVEYLIGCLKNPETYGKTFDIGGPIILNYKQLMDLYAEEAKLKKRVVLSLPINDPLKSTAYLISRIVPLESSIINPLIESLRNEVICENLEILDYIPQELLPPREAIRRALSEVKQVLLHDTFQSLGWVPPLEWSYYGDASWSGGAVWYDRRAVVLKGDIHKLWDIISKIGGETGWYHANLLWKVRGYLDEFIGGPGIRRGRNHSKKLSQGDILDCWRVRRIVPESELLLSGEMKLPGHATLHFKCEETKKGKIIFDQVAAFVPHGLGGLMYWQMVLPFHTYVFNGMIRKIAKNADCKIVYGPKFLFRETKLF